MMHGYGMNTRLGERDIQLCLSGRLTKPENKQHCGSRKDWSTRCFFSWSCFKPMVRSEGGTKHWESTGLGRGVEISTVKISQR